METIDWTQYGFAGVIFLALMWLMHHVMTFFMSHTERATDSAQKQANAFMDCLTTLNTEADDRHKENIQIQRENIQALNTLANAVSTMGQRMPIRGGKREYDNE